MQELANNKTTDKRNVTKPLCVFLHQNVSSLLCSPSRSGTLADRGEVVHVSFHFASRSGTALNAERVTPIRPNGTFADARTENKRRNTKRDEEEKEETHEVVSYKTVIDRRPMPASRIVILTRSLRTTLRRHSVTVTGNFLSCKAFAAYDACLIASNSRFSSTVSLHLFLSLLTRSDNTRGDRSEQIGVVDLDRSGSSLSPRLHVDVYTREYASILRLRSARHLYWISTSRLGYCSIASREIFCLRCIRDYLRLY